MINYKNGKIYRIINTENETVYIGSTCQRLSQRLATHKHRGNGNKIVLVEDCPCENREQLFMREQAVIEEHNGLLNKWRAHTNPEQAKEIRREYRRNNKDRENERRRTRRATDEEYRNKDNETRRNNRVSCEFCGTEVMRCGLKRHQGTKKCLAHQNN